jgi:hypothetical protein
MSTLENRIEEMQKKASAKSAELQTMATAPVISDKKKERLENRAEKVEERADKREGVMRSNAEWWEWIKGGMNSAPATTPQSNTTNQPQTTPQQPITTTPPQTEAEGGATPQTTTTTTSEDVDFDINKDGVVDNTETLIGIAKQGNQQRMDVLKVLQEAQAKGLSAYQTLLKDSFKRKEEVAKKQERNARSQAIANALGSLVNVITAGAIAKRNGSIPIIAEYDDTADSALRKSIEQRYALANENENLLMNLENERRKHEAEVARQNYAQEIASIDAETKAKIAPIAQQIALEEYEQKAKIRANAQKDVRTHAGEVQKDVNAEKQKNDGGKPKPFKYDKAKIDQFVAEATTWDYEEDDPVIKGRKVKKTHTSKPSSAESNVAEQVAKYCQENKVSDNVTSVLSEVYRKLFQTIKPEVTKKFGNDLTKNIISAIKAGRNADEAYNVAKTYIEENK